MSFLSATGGGNVDASGGTTVTTFTDSGGIQYQIHAFENVGTDTFTVNDAGTLGTVDVLVVGGGGGGGGSAHGGGGGAGGVLFEQNVPITDPTQYTITVGDGGAGKQGEFSSPWLNPGTNFGDNGGDSNAFGLTALGGGGGGGYSGGDSSDTDGQDGGSGGGGTDESSPGQGLQPTSVDGGLGNDGGTSTTNSFSQGGGGAGERGDVDGLGYGGDGASFADEFSNAFGENGYFGGGGGGAFSGVNDPINDTGGLGGGGNSGSGEVSPINPEDGQSNTGGGGGGAERNTNGDARGGDGGSGIVLIRYEI